MNIAGRFPDRLIASTQLNPALVPGLKNKSIVGPMISPMTLDQIAHNVKINLQNVDESASHARPSMFANISSFCQNVHEAIDAVQPGKAPSEYLSLSETVKDDFLEWQGLVALIALNQIFSSVGVNLSIERMDLKADSYIELCIMREMVKDEVYRDAITESTPSNEPIGAYLFYICQNGTPFAIYHPTLGLCPMKQYDSSIFKGLLPWFEYDEEDCHKGWKDFIGTGLLDQPCIDRISWWAQQNGMDLYQLYLKPETVPSEKYISSVQIANTRSINQITAWEGKGDRFGTSMTFYQSQQGIATALPELFLSELLLSYVGSQDKNQMVYRAPGGDRKVCFQNCPPELQAFAPVVPLREAAVEVLQTCRIYNLVFTAKIELGKIRSVCMKIQLQNGDGEVLTILRKYSSAHIHQGRLPYMMVWPFVPLPEDQEIWKSFYCTWQNPMSLEHLIPDNEMLLDRSQRAFQSVIQLRYTFDDQGRLYQINRSTASDKPWYVCEGSSPFRYAHIIGRQDEKSNMVEMGMLFIPTYPTYDPALMPGVNYIKNNNPVVLSIDFGTTSTVCGTRIGSGAISPLPFKDYGHCVTWDDTESKAKLDMEQWLGNPSKEKDWVWDHKIFSVAQLFERGDADGPDLGKMPTGNAEYYVDGRLFLVSGEALANYSEPIAGVKDPLAAQQIMTDMKFIEVLDTKNYHAASLYLAGLYEYAVLHLLDEKILPTQGAEYIELRVSYPNEVTLEALRRSWYSAAQVAGKDMAPDIIKPIHTLLGNNAIHFYHEATAAAVYQQAAGNLVGVSNLLFMDIGGGTTDISLSSRLMPEDVRKLSVRYAGREIMVSTLIEYFRKFRNGSNVVREDCFKKLWNSDSILAQRFLNICDNVNPGMVELKGLTSNSSARMSIEMLLSEGMHLPSLQTGDIETTLLRELITAKFIMLLMLTARLVRNNIDMWRRPDGKLNLIGGKLSIDLAVGGTSAQLLQYIFDCSMEDLVHLQQPVFERNDNMDCCRSVFNSIFAAELKDIPLDSAEPSVCGVDTDLKFYVDPQVSKKLEVCYGMLEPDINRVANNMRNRKANYVMSEAERNMRKDDTDREIRIFPSEKLDAYLTNGLDGYESTHCLVHYLEEYEKIFFPSSMVIDRGLGGNILNISGLLKQCTSVLPQSQNSVADERAAYMVEIDQEPYKELLACMYLVEDCLNWKMANLQ